MRSRKLELASVGAFALIVTGLGFTPKDEGCCGSLEWEVLSQGHSKASGPRKES